MIYLALLKRFWQAILIIFLMGIVGYLKLENANLKVAKIEMEFTLKQLKVASDAEYKRFAAVQKSADKWHLQAVKEQKELLQMKIPKDCEGAVAAAVNWAKNL